MGYTLYIAECADGTLYTGIAKNVLHRIAEHNGLLVDGSPSKAKRKGARYTSARRPVRLVYEVQFASRAEALREEFRVKRLTRAEKLRLIKEASKAIATAR